MKRWKWQKLPGRGVFVQVTRTSGWCKKCMKRFSNEYKKRWSNKTGHRLLPSFEAWRADNAVFAGAVPPPPSAPAEPAAPASAVASEPTAPPAPVTGTAAGAPMPRSQVSEGLFAGGQPLPSEQPLRPARACSPPLDFFGCLDYLAASENDEALGDDAALESCAPVLGSRWWYCLKECMFYQAVTFLWQEQGAATPLKHIPDGYCETIKVAQDFCTRASGWETPAAWMGVAFLWERALAEAYRADVLSLKGEFTWPDLVPACTRKPLTKSEWKTLNGKQQKKTNHKAR